ncbi:MAG TPA: thermonuclease family protein [Burkholderiales bacterium]|nr:thermonuclease family protein [Burkholderiales bacterium]
MSRPAKVAVALLALALAAPEPLDARSSGGRSGSHGGHGHKAGSSGSLMLKRFGGGSGLRVMNASVLTTMPGPLVSPAQYWFTSARYISFTHGRLFGSAPARPFSYAGYPSEVQLGAAAVAVDGQTFSANGVRYRVLGLDALDLRDEGARERLQRVLASGPVTVESRGVDKYGRTVALVRVDGHDVAPSLRTQGVARAALKDQD